MKMAAQNNRQFYLHHLYFLAIILTHVLSSNVFIESSSTMYPFSCSDQVQNCDSYLYHISDGLSIEQIASFYSVKSSNVEPITHGLKQDFLVSVPCTCKDVNGTQGYFYDTFYSVQSGDIFANVTWVLYSGQAWEVPGVERLFIAGDMISVHLVCGCLEVEAKEIVTYTVQENDTLTGISELLSAELTGIENLNERFTRNPNLIDVGWVLFVPREKNGIQAPKQGKQHHLTIILGTLSAVTLFSVCSLLLFLHRRNRNHKNRKEDPEVVNKARNATFESERPIVYSSKEIDEATSQFDERRKIGAGGYGIVYIGTLKEREVAIKKMKSSRSKEFYSELKVLCKIHHINVVELLGYATGDNHLYLVYEYIQNGSLNDHLHDPLLKGHSPLSWLARAQIALDAARGIEYIHDHTKARYVHRDIKTSNILLDKGLGAKVADFGLARLVERSNEEDAVATRLVGTPGYIAPESVRELQMTSKTDVFSFGVVLAELITGQRALARDNGQPNKMKVLVSVMTAIFRDQDPETALEANIDENMKGSYPMDEVYKMAELSTHCMNEDPTNRPEMREIVQKLSKILMSSIEWEASLGGSSQVFTRLFDGR
uniref:Lyk 9 n=1 Tax=Populus canadensis TaxID=3690 RepID=A0A0H3W5M9_POPCA|nr:Lyk 9 [Populus x canadensis]